MTETEFRTKIMPLQRIMYGIALRAGIPPDEAGDAVQESMLRLWRHRVRLPAPPQELKAYCLTVHRNECIRRLSKPSLPAADIAEAMSMNSADNDEVEYRDTRHHIERLIDSLPEGQKKVIRLSSFAGFDHTEIARITGQTDNNVRQLLSRGRRRLRELLSKDK